MHVHGIQTSVQADEKIKSQRYCKFLNFLASNLIFLGEARAHQMPHPDDKLLSLPHIIGKAKNDGYIQTL